MSTTTTTNLALIKSAYNTEADTWGAHINDSFDLIDAFAGKVPVKISSGLQSNGTLSLTVPAGYGSYVLYLEKIRVSTGDNGAQLYVRLSNSATYATGSTAYEFSRRDLSSQ